MYPHLKHEDIIASIAYASELMSSEEVIVAARNPIFWQMKTLTAVLREGLTIIFLRYDKEGNEGMMNYLSLVRMITSTNS